LIEDRLAGCQQNLNIIKKGVIADISASKLKATLEIELDHLQRLSFQPSINPDQRQRYQRRIKRLRQKVLRVNAIRHVNPVLANFLPSQRKLLTEVFNIIYQATDDLQAAQGLIDRVVSRLNRARGRRQQLTKRPRHS
jgi:hypothetical protein